MTATKIKQSDVAERFNLKPNEIKEFRDGNLVRDTDWWKEGTTIYWTEDAARFLELKRTPETTTMQVRVIKPCPNPRFVYADLNGEKITVQCGTRHSRKILGKTITVRRDEDGTTYTYEP